ncbi:MAG: DUF6599 family protein [Thermoanaerobaculaceae bacterium]
MARPAVLVVLVAALAAAGPAASATLADLQRALPVGVGQLEAAGPGEIYGPERIFDYLDGGAEVYLAYGLVGCLAREYRGAGITVVADVFELASSADAFGAFTHDQDGEEVPVGQGALLRPGWLSFWKGPYFVSLTADADTPPAQAALVELARAIAAVIPVEGKPPELLRWLPAKGLATRSARFFRSPILLRTHLPRIEGNPLLLAPDTEAVLGRVRRGGARGCGDRGPLPVRRTGERGDARSRARPRRGRQAAGACLGCRPQRRPGGLGGAVELERPQHRAHGRGAGAFPQGGPAPAQGRQRCPHVLTVQPGAR